MLTITPTITALLGMLVTRYMPYGPWSIAACILGSITIIKVLRSPVAPAISACVLALALDDTSWLYPASILIGTCLLAGLSMVHQRLFAASQLSTRPSAVDALDDELERAPRQFAWVPFFTAFLLLAYLCSTWIGMRMVFFPPLVVIAFEMFAHADIWPWAQRPIILPCVCMAAAAAGVATLAFFGIGVVSTILAMLVGVVTLRLSRVRVTPALAVALLPQVMPHVDWHFPLAVGVGSALLTVFFLTFRQFSPADQRGPG